MNKSIRIIIVDDNEIDLMIGKRLISRVEANIVVNTFLSCESLYEWLNQFKKEEIPTQWVFLIDIYMPKCNGFEVVKELTNLMKPITKNTSYYLLSATIDFADVQRIKMDNTIKEFIGKPITVDLIQKMLTENK
tara:strand:+ start:48178 stop:48579 length:402 start_codon:yes stop_codon:yes gene_type:complete